MDLDVKTATGTIEARLIAAAAFALGLPVSALSVETPAEQVEAWDSLAHINLISEVESEFGISIPTEAIADIHSLGDLLPFIERST